MRMRWIGCSLILLISAEVIQGWREVCRTDLFKQLNDESLEVTQVEETLVEVKDPDNTKIGQATVTQLLMFRDTSCELEGLTSVHFRAPGPVYCEELTGFVNRYKDHYINYKNPASNYVLRVLNKGVSRFLEHYMRERLKACAKEVRRFLQVALDEMTPNQSDSPDNKIKILEEFYSWWDLKPKKKKFIKNLDIWFDHENYFSSCITLIETLKKNIPNHDAGSFYRYDKFISQWREIDYACKDYGRRRCSMPKILRPENWKEQCQIIAESLDSSPL